MRVLPAILAGLLLATPLACADNHADCLLIPPELEARVLYYHPFADGIDQPEVNPAKAKLQRPIAQAQPRGLSEPSLALAPAAKKPKGMALLSPEIHP